MIYICKHETDMNKAWDTKESFEKKLSTEVELLYKIQSYNKTGKKREKRVSYIISAAIERRPNAV